MLRIGFRLGLIALIAVSGVATPQDKPPEKPDPLANLCVVESVRPAPDKVKVGFASISGQDAVNYLRFISSDLLDGRDTGERGYAIAAEYAASMFQLWGVQPAGDFERPANIHRMMPPPREPEEKAKRGYFQNIAFREVLNSTGRAVAVWRDGRQEKSRSFSPDQDYSIFFSGSRSLTAPVVFVGYGIQESSLKFDEYKNLDVKGKFVMMLSETPRKEDPESPFNKGELKDKYNPPRRMRRMTDPKTQLAKELGATAVILVENRPSENGDIADGKLPRPVNDEQPVIPGARRSLSLVQPGNIPMPWDTIPTCRISREMADAILEFVGQDVDTLKARIEKDLKPQSMALSGVSLTLEQTVESKLIQCRNVLGWIEGSDPELKDEVVVIGAHFDHLGKRGDYIYNGADDNGSGSVGVMECAEAFAKNPVKPKRSVLFALWTGEEKGLLGSRYYVMNPFLPIENTVACVNLDMISRVYTKESLGRMARMFGEGMSKEALEKIDIESFVQPSYGAQTPELAEIMRANNQYVGLSMFLEPSENAMGGSDHAPFGMLGRPWVFFFAAMTEDYHQPSDSVDKVSIPLMEKIIRMTYLTAFDLADR